MITTYLGTFIILRVLFCRPSTSLYIRNIRKVVKVPWKVKDDTSVLVVPLNIVNLAPAHSDKYQNLSLLSKVDILNRFRAVRTT